MSLKHNPFDNSFKGTLIPRKKVFGNPTPPQPAPVEAIPTIEPAQEIQTKQKKTITREVLKNCKTETDTIYSQRVDTILQDTPETPAAINTAIYLKNEAEKANGEQMDFG